jgi:hypothetical protein
MTTGKMKAVKFSGWALGVALLSGTLLVASNAATNPFAGHIHVISTAKSGSTSATASGASSAQASMPTSSIASMPIWWGGNAFILSPTTNMSDTTVSAQGYEYVLPSDLTTQWNTLQSVFKVTGTEQKNPYGWQINGDQKNSGSLYLNISGIGSWSYYLNNYAISMGCYPTGVPTATPMPAPAKFGGSTSTGGTSTPGSGPSWIPTPCVTPQADPVSTAKAIEVAKSVHAQLGGPTNVEWSGQANSYSASVEVTAVPLLNGTKVTTGAATSWHYSVGPDGNITSASGSFATPVIMRNLPVLGERSAAERVNGKQWSAFGPFVTGNYPIGIMSSNGTDVPTHIAGQINVGINRVTVKSPVATLIEYWNADGTLMLLPGYQYSADKSQKFAVIAVSDSRVTFTQAVNSGIQPMMK